MIALPYNEYLQRYGATREAMASVVVEARTNGARIPWSYWHGKPLTVDDYLARAGHLGSRSACTTATSPSTASPRSSSRPPNARSDLPHPPVYVAGYAQGHPDRHRLPLHWPLDDIMDVAAQTSPRLWDTRGCRSHDVDVPQLYDGFSPFVWFWLEALGYCPAGEAHRFVADGGISVECGGLPALSGGGALGNGRMHGVPQMLECYLQLSQRAGERQLASSNVGVACHSSPHWGGAVLYSREPL